LTFLIIINSFFGKKNPLKSFLQQNIVSSNHFAQYGENLATNKSLFRYGYAIFENCAMMLL
jgi:hypothetical protein